MREIGEVSWSEVFQGWADRESANPAWIDCATNIKGWDTWEDWRMYTVKQLKLTERIWRLFEIEDPLGDIPRMKIGPFGSWQRNFETKLSHTFQDLLELQQGGEWISSHEVIESIRKSLPFDTSFIGLRNSETTEITLIDGHHRASAITLAAHHGDIVNFNRGQVRIALANFDPTEEGAMLINALQTGSAKPSNY